MRGRPRKYKTPEESEFMKKKLLQEKNSKNRLTVLQFYSAQIPFCKCCGEKEMKFLSMDHVNGGGNKHRKELGFKGGKGGNISFWIIKNNFPDGFQVLCHNCNMAKAFYGKCPHQIIL